MMDRQFTKKIVIKSDVPAKRGNHVMDALGREVGLVDSCEISEERTPEGLPRYLVHAVVTEGTHDNIDGMGLQIMAPGNGLN